MLYALCAGKPTSPKTLGILTMPAFALRQHHRQERLAAVDHAHRLMPSLPLDFVDVRVLEGTDHGDTGVVENVVRGAERLCARRRRAQDPFSRGDIKA